MSETLPSVAPLYYSLRDRAVSGWRLTEARLRLLSKAVSLRKPGFLPKGRSFNGAGYFTYTAALKRLLLLFDPQRRRICPSLIRPEITVIIKPSGVSLAYAEPSASEEGYRNLGGGWWWRGKGEEGGGRSWGGGVRGSLL